VTDNGVATDYTPNNVNQYTKVGNTLLTYDTNGNLTSHDATYTYDAQNRLISAAKGGNEVTFAYDPRNRCVKRTINGVPTFFYFDRWDLIDERDASDVQIARYVNGPQMDEILSRNTANGSIYYHHDSIGNVIALTDNTGTVVERYSYDIFGAPTIRDANGTILDASAFGNRFMFTGREFVQQVGVYDFRNRFYSQELGRFLQVDPSGFAAGDYNLYRYVKNNPVNQVDGLGLSTYTLAAVASWLKDQPIPCDLPEINDTGPTPSELPDTPVPPPPPRDCREEKFGCTIEYMAVCGTGGALLAASGVAAGVAPAATAACSIAGAANCYNEETACLAGEPAPSYEPNPYFIYGP
jgi:RHS repeat-associated protein